MRQVRLVGTGSAMLLMLLTLATLIMLCSKQWFSTSLILDAVLAKEEHEKKYWLLHGLLECSVMLCKNRWDILQHMVQQEHKKTMTLHIPPSHLPQSLVASQKRATLTITYQDDQKLFLCVRLFQESRIVGTQQCMMTTDTQNKIFRVRAWSV